MITERVELQQDVSRPAGVAAKAVEKLSGALAKLAAVNIDPNAAGAIKLIEDAANKLALTKRRQQTDEEKAVAAAKRAAASASRELKWRRPLRMVANRSTSVPACTFMEPSSRRNHGT